MVVINANSVKKPLMIASGVGCLATASATRPTANSSDVILSIQVSNKLFSSGINFMNSSFIQLITSRIGTSIIEY